MGSRTRPPQTSATSLLAPIPGLVLSIATAFLLGLMTATGTFSTFEVTANVAVFTLLAGVSAVAITLPEAISIYPRVPRRARSIYWRRLTWALLNRFVGGGCAAIGVLALIWIRMSTSWLPTTGMAVIAVVAFAVAVESWRVGGRSLSNTPRTARAALRRARAFLSHSSSFTVLDRRRRRRGLEG